MRVEVDQSGKIGKTNVDTVLAYSNDRQYTVRIPRAVKRRCLQELRNQGVPAKRIYTRLFVIGLYFLLREHISSIDTVVIDVEYPGHDDRIRRYLLNLLRRDGLDVDKDLFLFARIGKKSTAHSLALATYRGQKRAHRVLSAEDILEQFR